MTNEKKPTIAADIDLETLLDGPGRGIVPQHLVSDRLRQIQHNSRKHIEVSHTLPDVLDENGKLKDEYVFKGNKPITGKHYIASTLELGEYAGDMRHMLEASAQSHSGMFAEIVRVSDYVSGTTSAGDRNHLSIVAAMDSVLQTAPAHTLDTFIVPMLHFKAIELLNILINDLTSPAAADVAYHESAKLMAAMFLGRAWDMTKTVKPELTTLCELVENIKAALFSPECKQGGHLGTAETFLETITLLRHTGLELDELFITYMSDAAVNFVTPGIAGELVDTIADTTVIMLKHARENKTPFDEVFEFFCSALSSVAK